MNSYKNVINTVAGVLRGSICIMQGLIQGIYNHLPIKYANNAFQNCAMRKKIKEIHSFSWSNQTKLDSKSCYLFRRKNSKLLFYQAPTTLVVQKVQIRFFAEIKIMLIVLLTVCTFVLLSKAFSVKTLDHPKLIQLFASLKITCCCCHNMLF